MYYLVRRSNAGQRPLLFDAIHLLRKQVKVNLGYRGEHLEFVPRHTRRWIVHTARGEIVEFSSRGQEDGDEGYVPEGAQSTPEFRECSPRPIHRWRWFNQAVRLIPAYHYVGLGVPFPWVQELDNLLRDLYDTHGCSTLP